MIQIILASSSPRRKTLFQSVGLPFQVHNPAFDESEETDKDPAKLVEILSIKKAEKTQMDLKGLFDNAIIIAADTVVSIDASILGKPRDENDAFHMLKHLQGKRHQVYTGTAFIHKEQDIIRQFHYVDSTTVFMRPLSDAEIWAYVKTGEPMDKAGAYGIQEKGACLIEKIQGDYFTVVGLPMTRIYDGLKACNLNLFALQGQPPEAH